MWSVMVPVASRSVYPHAVLTGSSMSMIVLLLCCFDPLSAERADWCGWVFVAAQAVALCV